MKAKKDKTGQKRENEQKVGPGKPPAEHQFTPENQPVNRGRKKDKPSMTTILRGILSQSMDFNDPLLGKTIKRTVYEIINFKLVALAIGGNMDAIKEINNRIDGRQKFMDIHIGDRNDYSHKNIIIVRSPNAKPLKNVDTVDIKPNLSKT